MFRIIPACYTKKNLQSNRISIAISKTCSNVTNNEGVSSDEWIRVQNYCKIRLIGKFFSSIFRISYAEAIVEFDEQ